MENELSYGEKKVKYKSQFIAITAGMFKSAKKSKSKREFMFEDIVSKARDKIGEPLPHPNMAGALAVYLEGLGIIKFTGKYSTLKKPSGRKGVAKVWKWNVG